MAPSAEARVVPRVNVTSLTPKAIARSPAMEPLAPTLLDERMAHVTNAKDDNPSEHPRQSPHHDVLVITPRGEYHRFPVEKVGEEEGRYTRSPLQPGGDEPGTRKVLNMAQQGTAELPRGPAFSTLAVNPDPAASSCAACYLVNTENLNYVNPWTAAALSDGGPRVLEDERWTDESFELLIAGPRGKVYHLAKGLESAPTVREVDLDGEVEVWAQLRNGLVAGSVEYRRPPGEGPRVVPVVNVTSLTPKHAKSSRDG